MAAVIGNKNHLKHGMRNTRLYNIWKSMRQRCHNPNNSRHSIYHDKGITVCEEWNDFMAFHSWAILNGYSEDLTIDRIDVNGNYEPSNCRWVTYKAQANNKSNNRYLEYNGEVHTLGEWSAITGIKLPTIWNRLKLGWNIERTLTEKAIIGKNQYN